MPITPPIVGAKAMLKPINPIKNNENPVIIRVLYRLLSSLWFSSPISRNPTEIVIVNTSKLASKTHRSLIRFGSMKNTYGG